jgi:Antitoxin VbhA
LDVVFRVTELQKATRRVKVVRAVRRASELEGSRSTDATRADQVAYARGTITAAQLRDRVRTVTTRSNRTRSASLGVLAPTCVRFPCPLDESGYLCRTRDLAPADEIEGAFAESLAAASVIGPPRRQTQLPIARLSR